MVPYAGMSGVCRSPILNGWSNKKPSLKKFLAGGFAMLLVLASSSRRQFVGTHLRMEGMTGCKNASVRGRSWSQTLPTSGAHLS
ncbi:uncharacterized protein BDZ99DRAFT_468917 [Mytilinidion resinicola]|uniref:Uncharacterized protein n=1 Tax=Mytilinidion resinicola TaxID=574789 RepID=A0A6A6Y3V1_9PEZI|nr:uncharacterized protein BDZ99DRAFT_468917 [Mytilinidion resinicola]KAF2802457.1 hypothetical protein BDZ99DRAFT_468917 [Mytilinidion resinicola]